VQQESSSLVRLLCFEFFLPYLAQFSYLHQRSTITRNKTYISFTTITLLSPLFNPPASIDDLQFLLPSPQVSRIVSFFADMYQHNVAQIPLIVLPFHQLQHLTRVVSSVHPSNAYSFSQYIPLLPLSWRSLFTLFPPSLCTRILLTCIPANELPPPPPPSSFVLYYQSPCGINVFAPASTSLSIAYSHQTKEVVIFHHVLRNRFSAF